MIKAYFATSNTGTPLLGKNFILKDKAGQLPDVPMTEIGAGHYVAELGEGTAWNVYDGATNTGVVLDALFAQTREPAIAGGNSAHAYFGKKVFRQITISDIAGLASSLNSQSAQINQLLIDVEQLDQYIQDLQSARTFVFGGKIYAMDPITVMDLPGYREDGVMGAHVKANWIITEPNEANPYFNLVVPGDGSWVDAFRAKQFVFSSTPVGFNTGYAPVGLLHNIQSAFSVPYLDGTGDITSSLDFRFSLLGKNPFSELGFIQIGSSVIGKLLGTYREDAGGSPRIVSHSIRGIGAQISAPGIQTKIKIEVRLKTPGAPLVIDCNGGVTAQMYGQLYPEVP